MCSRMISLPVYRFVRLLRIGYLLTLILCGLLLASRSSPAAEAAWKYDLHPGDHLIYHYQFERSYRGEDGESRTRAVFNNHVIVVGEKADRISVGFQRNRESSELLMYKEHGKDKLAEELPKFRERMTKRSPRFSEAMEFNLSGEPLTQWEAVRETSGRLIVGIHEIEALPQHVLGAGESWQGANLLGIKFTLAGREKIHDKNCDRIDGMDSSSTIHLRFWWCEGRGAIERLKFEGEYEVPGGKVSEVAEIQLLEGRRGENIAQWMQTGEVRNAALQALLTSPWIRADAQTIEAGLKANDPRYQALALTYIFQRSAEQFSTEAIRSLSESSDPTVARLASLTTTPNGQNTDPQAAACSVRRREFPHQKIGTTVRLINDKKLGVFPYMMRVPAEYRPDRKSPLLIYLSGGAGLAIDGVNTAEDAVRSTDYLVLYPQAGTYWWTADARGRVDWLLDEVLQEFNVDTNRVYIAGFSNGGTGALDFAELRPHRFAGAVSLMGAGTCNEQVAQGLKNLSDLSMLFVHGDSDPRIPASCSRDTADRLKQLGMETPPLLQILKNREHDVTLQQDDGLSLPFLANLSRNPFPLKFTAHWEDMSFPRRYWIELLEKGSGPAEVEARAQNNRIEIKAHGVKRLRILLRSNLISGKEPLTVVINKKTAYQGKFAPNCKTFDDSSKQERDALLGYEQAIDLSAEH